MATKKKAPAAQKIQANAKNLSPLEQEAIKAHSEWKDTEKVLTAFVSENEPVFTTYGALCEEYNQKLQVADHAIRQTDKSYSEWRKSSSTHYNPEALFSLVGKKKFLEMGGEIKTQTVYVMSPENIDLAIAKNLVNEDKSFKEVKPKFLGVPKPKS